MDPRRPQRGLSLVELMVGMALGLLVVGGAITMFLAELKTSRRLLLEARLAHDLRTAADTLARDLRRASHWVASTTADPVANPHGTILLDEPSPTTANTFRRASYSFDLPDAGTPQASVFAHRDQKLTLKLGGSGAQELTDPTVVRITRLAITPVTTVVSLDALCPTGCTVSGGCPTLAVRSYDIELEGQATADPSLRREVRTSAHVRNDQWSGTCTGT